LTIWRSEKSCVSEIYHSLIARCCKQELDDLAQVYQELRAKLDQAEGGDVLAPWRRALDG